jgi:SAM-dependent methyltransferase
MYDKSYFSDGGGWVCGFWGGSYESNERHLRDEALQALADIPHSSGRMLEIGCAGGFFLDEAQRAGFEVTGVELNADMAEHAREKLGLAVHCGMFEDAGLEPDSFDVIVVQDVLEHVRGPLEFVASIARLLRPGGCFFVRGPLEDQAKDRVYLVVRRLTRRGNVFVREPPFHLQGFTRESFARVIQSAGLMPQTFVVSRTPAQWNFGGAKNAAATLVDQAAFLADRLRDGGGFMLATASRPR